ncbi:DUF3108 domain-containing protein [Psychromonas sp. MME2]|uniref:DUF3108 domain-containing protein n=1 Tax=unclassified Psychromonas TaxID=2614957 RepID=UPI00339C7FEA
MLKKTSVIVVFLLSAMTPFFIQAKQAVGFKDSKQHYVYNIYYKNYFIGEISRDISYYNNHISITSHADLSFLSYDFFASQDSQLYWSIPLQQVFVKKFNRVSDGFGISYIQADFFDDGHRTRLVNNGKESEYISEVGRILDFNGLSLQLVEELKSGQVSFDYYMQTSKAIMHYFFAVKGQEVIDSKFGKLTTLRVEQIKKNDRTLVAWFAPELNYQMVKFHYKRKLLDVSGVLSEYSVIPMGINPKP